MTQYRNIIRHGESVEGEYRRWADMGWMRFRGSHGLMTIRHAWEHGDSGVVRAIWSAQDGYGPRGYTPPQGYDWSGIRDSSPGAHARMEGIAAAWWRRTAGADTPWPWEQPEVQACAAPIADA